MARYFSPDEIPEIQSKAEGLIAAVLAHELGHAMNNDTKNVRVTTRVYNEVKADQFAVRLMAEAGFDPMLVADMLELLGKLHSNKGIKELIHEFMDEHPRANYRIAAVAELIQHSRSSTERKGEYLGYRSLDRAGKEVSSKNSVTSFLQKLSKASYIKLTTREKLRFLETYFATSLKEVDFMTRKTLVAIGAEYSRLASESKDINTTNQIIDSVLNFQNTQDLNEMKGSDPTEDVKTRFKKLNHQLTKNIYGHLDANEKMDLSALVHFSKYFDEKTILGLFGKALANTKSYQEVVDILWIKRDSERRSFHQLFYHYSKTDLNVVYRKATLALMRLDPTPNKVVEALMPIVTLGKNSSAGLTELAKGVILFALNNDKIYWEDFVEKLIEPKTGDNFVLAGAFQSEDMKVFFYNRRFLQDSSDLTYGIGRRFSRKKFDSDFLSIMYLGFHYQGQSSFQPSLNEYQGQSSFQLSLNDIISNAYDAGVSVVESVREFAVLKSKLELDVSPRIKTVDFIDLEQRLVDKIPRHDRHEIMQIALYSDSFSSRAEFEKHRVDLNKYFDQLFTKLLELDLIKQGFVDRFTEDIRELDRLGKRLVKKNTGLSKEDFKSYRRLLTIIRLNSNILRKKKGVVIEELMQSSQSGAIFIYLRSAAGDISIKAFSRLVNNLTSVSKEKVVRMMESGDYEVEGYIDSLRAASKVIRSRIGIESNLEFSEFLEHLKFDFRVKYMREWVTIGGASSHVTNIKYQGRKIDPFATKWLYPESVEILESQSDIDFYNDSKIVQYAEWASSLSKGIEATDPIEALIGAIGYVGSSLNWVKDEQTVRADFLMFSRALSLVKNDKQMKEFSVYFSLFLRSGGFNSSMFGSGVKPVGALRARTDNWYLYRLNSSHHNAVKSCF